MAVHVTFHRLAIAEYRAARDWYANRSATVAERFRAAVEQAVDRMQSHPERLGSIGKNYQYLRIERFPYILISRRTSEMELLIVAVAHTSRRPGYWRRRK